MSPTMEDRLRQAALLNTKGIHALVMGRKNFCTRALGYFSQALQEMEAAKAVSLQQQQRQHQYQPLILEAFNSSSVSNLDDCASFYVYNRAVFFHPLSDTSFVGLSFYTAILHFNLAITLHTKQNKNKPAMKQYKACLKVLRQVGVCGRMADRPPYPGGGEAMIYLRLAALNNMAHLYARQGEFDNCTKTLKRVFQFTLAQQQTLLLLGRKADEEEVMVEEDTTSSDQTMEDCSLQGTQQATTSQRGTQSIIQNRQTTNSLNLAFVNEVLLNVMVTSGPTVMGAGAA